MCVCGGGGGGCKEIRGGVNTKNAERYKHTKLVFLLVFLYACVSCVSSPI